MQFIKMKVTEEKKTGQVLLLQIWNNLLNGLSPCARTSVCSYPRTTSVASSVSPYQAMFNNFVANSWLLLQAPFCCQVELAGENDHIRSGRWESHGLRPHPSPWGLPMRLAASCPSSIPYRLPGVCVRTPAQAACPLCPEVPPFPVIKVILKHPTCWLPRLRKAHSLFNTAAFYSNLSSPQNTKGSQLPSLRVPPSDRPEEEAAAAATAVSRPRLRTAPRRAALRERLRLRSRWGAPCWPPGKAARSPHRPDEGGGGSGSPTAGAPRYGGGEAGP